MTVHHLNCATFRPLGSFGGRVAPQRMVAHCLLVERPGGLLLVDTGFGNDDIRNPGRLGRPFVNAMRPALDLAETAKAQVEARGFTVDDVTDIVLTHLDLDHAGGLADFPRARVHVYDAELEAALAPSPRERPRYIRAQWAHDPQWVRHHVQGEDWKGLGAVTVLDDDVLLVPLHGHTRGHCGVALRTDDGWLLHAGDAYFDGREKDTPPQVRRSLAVYQRLMSVDDLARRHNQERIRELRAANPADLTVFSAHDPDEYAAFA